MMQGLKAFFTGKNFMRSLLAFIIVVTGIAYIFGLTFSEVPPANREFANLCLGYVVGLISGVTLYYFGTSQGSSDKDETIKSMTPVPDKSKTVSVTESEVVPPKKEGF